MTDQPTDLSPEEFVAHTIDLPSPYAVIRQAILDLGTVALDPDSTPVDDYASHIFGRLIVSGFAITPTAERRRREADKKGADNAHYDAQQKGAT